MSYDELKAILDRNREHIENANFEKLVACPVCGHAPLDERDGILNCPLGNWRSDIQ